MTHVSTSAWATSLCTPLFASELILSMAWDSYSYGEPQSSSC